MYLLSRVGDVKAVGRGVPSTEWARLRFPLTFEICITIWQVVFKAVRLVYPREFQIVKGLAFMNLFFVDFQHAL